MALKQQAANRVIGEIIGSVCKAGNWMVLILDKTTTRVVSSCCKMHDILAVGITLVEGLEKSREPIPNMDAIYIISPTDNSVKKFIEDFESGDPMYQAAHLFFSHSCPPALMNKISATKHAKRRIRTLKEADLAFLPYESNVFHLDAPDALLELYNPGSTGYDILKAIPTQVASLCAFLGQYPAVRYRNAHQRTREIAEAIQLRLEQYKADNVELGCNQGNSEIVILDRGVDVITPILHELTYQAMVYDLLPIDNDVYRYEAETQAGASRQKETILDEEDDQWVRYRHQHIAEVSQAVSSNLQDFLSSKKLKKLDSAKASVKEIHRLIKRAPQYQHELDHYAMHIHIAGDCMSQYSQSVKELCMVEQDLAMGVDTNGSPVADPMQRIMPILFNRGIDVENKLRILALYIALKGGVETEDYARLMQHAEVPSDDRKTIKNLQLLGAHIFKDDGKQKQKHLKWKKRSVEGKYEVSRWTPRLKDIVEFAIANGLDESLYPYIKKPHTKKASTTVSQPSPNPGAATGGPTSVRWQWTKSAGTSGSQDKGVEAAPVGKKGTLIFFIIGGMSYSEMRVIYEVAKDNPGYDLIIGSSHLLTPELFLNQVKKLK